MLDDSLREDVHGLQARRELAPLPVDVHEADLDALAEAGEQLEEQHQVEADGMHARGLVAKLRRVLPAQRPELAAKAPPLHAVRAQDDADCALLDEDQHAKRDQHRARDGEKRGVLARPGPGGGEPRRGGNAEENDRHDPPRDVRAVLRDHLACRLEKLIHLFWIPGLPRPFQFGERGEVARRVGRGRRIARRGRPSSTSQDPSRHVRRSTFMHGLASASLHRSPSLCPARPRSCYAPAAHGMLRTPARKSCALVPRWSHAAAGAPLAARQQPEVNMWTVSHLLLVAFMLDQPARVEPAPPITTARVVILSTMLSDDFIGEWGFSALVQANGRQVLFDTGAKPDTVLQNA